MGQWLFLALASVLLIRKHLLIIAASFSLVLFKVQIALLCFLIMKNNYVKIVGVSKLNKLFDFVYNRVLVLGN